MQAPTRHAAVPALRQALNRAESRIAALEKAIEEKDILLARADATVKRAALVYQQAGEAMVIVDANGVVQDINPAFTKVTGYTTVDIIGRELQQLYVTPEGHGGYQDIGLGLNKSGHWDGDVWIRGKQGNAFMVNLAVDTLYDHNGTVGCRVGLFSDVTESRYREASIWHQANYDHLTQLPNRQMFYQNLRQSIGHAIETELPFALVFLDLDLFKEVNDSYGHDEGDELLRLVALRLRGCVRSSDAVARLGGDEFTIILPDIADSANTILVVEKILKTVSEPYRLRDAVVHVSVSAGVTYYPQDGADGVELLKHADLAMYAAKEHGRNQYCQYTGSMQRTADARRTLLADLRQGLENNQFVLHYQPIVDMQTGVTVKAEALMRWQHPERGLLAPSEFILQAEDAGLISPMGDWAFRHAAQQVAQWRQTLAPNFEVSVNVSPVQFRCDGLDPESWVGCLNALHLPGSAVTVEITERLLMQANNESGRRLLAFRDAGIQVALDDFGTGHSSLVYLKRFHIDYIKIDQSFVSNLRPNSDDLVLCEAIIAMAHRLGLKVIAEGVSSQEQHSILRKSGCDYGQGFWYARPLPATEFASRLSLDSPC